MMKNQGMTLVTITFAMALGVIISYSLARVVQSGLGAQKHIELRAQLDGARRSIRDQISCAQTFAYNNVNPLTDCDGTRELILMRASSQNTAAYVNGGAIPSQNADGSRLLFGNTVVKATCSSAKGSIIVRIGMTIKEQPSKYLKDPLLKNFTYDLSDSMINPIFGSTSVSKGSMETLCSNSFSQNLVSQSDLRCSSTAPIMVGINFQTMSIKCATYDELGLRALISDQVFNRQKTDLWSYAYTGVWGTGPGQFYNASNTIVRQRANDTINLRLRPLHRCYYVTQGDQDSFSQIGESPKCDPGSQFVGDTGLLFHDMSWNMGSW